MLKTIRLKNFKLHEDTLIEAAPITVFIGPNNSGKSSIFQALLLLRQAASRNDQFLCQSTTGEMPAQPPYQYSAQRAVDMGRFEEVLRRTENDLQVEFSGIVHARKPVGWMDQACVSAHVLIRENQLVSHDGSVDVRGNKTSWEFVQGTPIKISALRLRDVQYLLQVAHTFQLTGSGGYRSDSPNLPPETLLQYNETSQWLAALSTNLLRSMHPIYALRGFEEWGYPITGFPPTSLELLTLHDRAIALPNALASDRRLKERLSEQLEGLLQISIDFEVVAGQRLKIWAKGSANNASETLFVNEGTGANQVPFIIVPVLLTPPNETVLLSEPEAHLHPKRQCELMRLLLTVAKKENIQFFIETHSEHVLHTILNAVARDEWSPADVALYYFAEPKNGVAEVGKREINQFGQVDGGLPGFFEQSLSELTDYLKALSKT